MIIFDGNDLRVISMEAKNKDRLIVSFSGLYKKHPETTGFGQGFFGKHDISAIYIISKASHWWQTPEFRLALNEVRRFADQNFFEHVITYGISMGGYGALIASDQLRAERVVAFAPQYSINPDEVPWETRWLKYARKIQFQGNDFANDVCKGDIILFSDPFCSLDQKHIDLIQKHRSITNVKVPFSGHELARVLRDCGLLGEATLSALGGSFDLKLFQQKLRKVRKESCLTFSGASCLLRTKFRLKRAIDLGSCSFKMLLRSPPTSLKPEHASVVHNYVQTLIDAKQLTVAIDVLDSWKSVVGSEDCECLRFRALIHAALNDCDGALRLIEEAIHCQGNDRNTHNIAIDFFERFANSDQVAIFTENVGRHFLQYPGSTLKLSKLLIKNGLIDISKSYIFPGSKLHPGYIERFTRLLLSLGSPSMLLGDLEDILDKEGDLTYLLSIREILEERLIHSRNNE
jgi:hypothetical protein